jgi:hypothetical protein
MKGREVPQQGDDTLGVPEPIAVIIFEKGDRIRWNYAK